MPCIFGKACLFVSPQPILLLFLSFQPCLFNEACLLFHAPLLSAFFPQRVEPPLQPSAVNPPPLPQILAFPLQRDVPPLHPLFACSNPPPLSVSLQRRGEAPLLPSTLRAYVPLLSALLLLTVYATLEPLCIRRSVCRTHVD